MENTFPEKLKIGAHTYTLTFAESWPEQTEGDLGFTDTKKCIIYIREGLPPSVTFSTVIHECFHVINTTIDHTLLDSLGEQISQVLWDNKLR